MSTVEERHIDNIIEEIVEIAQPFWEERPEPTPQELVNWGYQLSLQRPEYLESLDHAPPTPLHPEKKQHLLQLARNNPPEGLDTFIGRVLYYLGFGFLFGLKKSNQITLRVHARLLFYLHEEVASALEVDLLEQLFQPELDLDITLIRQRAQLVQLLRRQHVRGWLKVRQALYEPYTLSSSERAQLVRFTRQVLQPRDLHTLMQME